MMSAVSRAEARLGIQIPEELLDKAKQLTDRKMEAKGFLPEYTCPVCHNTEHLPGAKFCMVCGTAFPLKGDGR